MPDLATALQQVLRQVREDTPHLTECDFGLGIDEEVECDCDWLERVEAEQARRMRKAVEAGVNAAVCPIHIGEASGYLGIPECIAVAILAAQQERGSA